MPIILLSPFVATLGLGQPSSMFNLTLAKQLQIRTAASTTIAITLKAAIMAAAVEPASAVSLVAHFSFYHSPRMEAFTKHSLGF